MNLDSAWRSIANDPPDWHDVGKVVHLRRYQLIVTGVLEAEVWGEEVPIMRVSGRLLVDFTDWCVAVKCPVNK